MAFHIRSWFLEKCCSAIRPICLAATAVLIAAVPSRADVCGSVAGNLVQNCGFEAGSFSNWTLGGNLEGGTPPNNFYGVDNGTPYSGTYAAYIGVQGGGGSLIGHLGPFLELSQTLNLQAAKTYRVSFALAQNAPTDSPGSASYFDARFGGTIIRSEINAPNSGGYKLVSFLVNSSSSPLIAGSTTLQFDFQNDSDFYFFDDVSVAQVAVPEPGSGALVLSLLSAGVYMLRRRFTR